MAASLASKAKHLQAVVPHFRLGGGSGVAKDAVVAVRFSPNLATLGRTGGSR